MPDVAIHILKNVAVIRAFPTGERIATPVCELARNDIRYTMVCTKRLNKPAFEDLERVTMKKLLCIILLLSVLLCGCGPEGVAVCNHIDADDDGLCDTCVVQISTTVDFYVVNDLHGKLLDGDTQPGVDELTTYLKETRSTDDHVILLSTGDMWQGSPESNLTSGQLTTEWMNDLGFAAMALGNHEFDWGEDPIKENAALAEFPFLAINVYEHADDTLADYCQPSTVVDLGNVQIGIIGAIGDCYSSISADKVEEIYFKVGTELTELVKAESEKLRSEGADFIVYVLHDGYDDTTGGGVSNIKSTQLKSYYDVALSDGYVDLVFEGHTHQRYLLRDVQGVYHLQNKGENKGISHIEVQINPITGTNRIRQSNLIASGDYATYEDDPVLEQLLEKYSEQIAPAQEILGINATKRSSSDLSQLMADCYYEKGMELWGDQYDIALGGGFMSVRSPYELPAGEVNYGQLQMLLPFDNYLVLCSAKGRDLRDKFFETDNSRYYIAYGAYGESIKDNIDPDATYYLVTDTYSSLYGPNNLTEIARLDADIFARDLVADYIKAGGLE